MGTETPDDPQAPVVTEPPVPINPEQPIEELKLDRTTVVSEASEEDGASAPSSGVMSDEAADKTNDSDAVAPVESQPTTARPPAETSEGVSQPETQEPESTEQSELQGDSTPGEDTSPETDAPPADPPASDETANDPTSQAAAEPASTATASEDEAQTSPPAKKKESIRRAPPPPFVYDPAKITLRFLFANRDGLSVTVDCQPSDTVGEVKGALLSVWPKELPECSGGDKLRLICMGKGVLMPDTRTLVDCQVPTFKTHATPVNVSVRPENAVVGSQVEKKSSSSGGGGGTSSPSGGGRSGRGGGSNNGGSVESGCFCVIL